MFFSNVKVTVPGSCVTDHVEKKHKRQLEVFQEKAWHELGNYEKQEYADQPDRLVRLLLRLPALRLLLPDIMEELFFAGLIGNVQIDSIIPFMLNFPCNEFNSQMGILCPTGDSNNIEQLNHVEDQVENTTSITEAQTVLFPTPVGLSL